MEILKTNRFTPETREWIFRWNRYYQERWGKTLPVRELGMIPKKPSWARSLIIMHPAAETPGLSFANYQKNYVAQKYLNVSLDALFGADRRQERAYALWHRGYIEADGKYRGQSAEDIDDLGIRTIRLIEYLEFSHFFKWGTGLDREKGLSLDIRGETLFPETTTPASNIRAKAFWNPHSQHYGLYVGLEKSHSRSISRSVREVAI